MTRYCVVFQVYGILYHKVMSQQIAMRNVINLLYCCTYIVTDVLVYVLLYASVV